MCSLPQATVPQDDVIKYEAALNRNKTICEVQIIGDGTVNMEMWRVNCFAYLLPFTAVCNTNSVRK